MDSEGKFWFSVMSVLIAAVAVVLVSLIAKDAYQTRKVAEIIAHGADPATAFCAVNGSGANGAMDCNLILARLTSSSAARSASGSP